jgi:UDPglucose 6-dehydrogenase
MKEVMGPMPAVVDLRNIYPPDDLTQRGFVYESVGRPSQKQK